MEIEPVPVLPGQLPLLPLEPKLGSVKALVLELLRENDGICRRDAARIADIYELSNRIGELQIDGWQIDKVRCGRHNHRQRFIEYRLAG